MVMQALWRTKKPLLSRRNVVVSGIGIVSPLGLSSEESLQQLLQGKCAIESPGNTVYEAAYQSKKFPLALLPDRHVGTTDPSLHSTQREARHTKIAMKALQEALNDAGLDLHQNSQKAHFHVDRTRIGVNVGIGIPCLQDICDSGRHVENDRPNKISPFFVPKILGNTISGQIAVQLSLQGGSHCVSSACSTGAHCIGEAFRSIERGDCDIMIAGAAESCVHDIATTGFHRLRALSLTTSKPFDVSRDGFVIGEGGAVLILEEATHAILRWKELGMRENSDSKSAYRHRGRFGPPWHAEIIGYGVSSDGFHITAPHPEGAGCFLCMNRALEDAGVEMRDIDAVFAHATGTPRGDEIELDAVTKGRQASFANGEKGSTLPVLSFKGAIGHLLGAAGSVETAFAILCAGRRQLPVNKGLREPVPHDKESVLLPTDNDPSLQWSPTNRCVILKNSFGFGGTNASLVIATGHTPS